MKNTKRCDIIEIEKEKQDKAVKQALNLIDINFNLLNLCLEESLMSKNDSIVNAISSTNSILKDESFKDLVRYKCMASILIKLTVPEFKDMSCIEIAKCIKDTKARPNRSDEELLQEEIDLEKTEAGTANEKNTINDIVFLMKLPTGETIEASIASILKPELTINLEMQNTNNKRMIPRAIYYGASLLRDTVPAGDSKYTNIHKVYSIWFCNFNISETEMERWDFIKNEYVHRYGIYRYYDKSVEARLTKDPVADLICVALVELPRLREQAMLSGDPLDITAASLFFNTKDSVKMIEQYQKINLTKYRKVVAGRMNWELKTREIAEESRLAGIEEGKLAGIEEGKAEGIVEGRALGMKEGLAKGKEKGKA